MAGRISREQRQAIVRDFATRHNGVYNPKIFLEEVKKAGADHPAYGWFEWDATKAAKQYRLWQAREFARDLRITFSVDEVGRNGTMTVRTTEMPMVLSPTDGRQDGGGYFLTDPNNPDHMAEHCQQAGVALRAWINRYQAAIMHAGGSLRQIEDLAVRLESVPAAAKEAAE
jgi:hypothetical protein